jgi:cardiolipin synthase
MQFHAAQPVHHALMRAGVALYAYRASALHGKVAVIDGVWATVGSSNLDPLSLLLAREANVVVHDAAFAQGLRQQLLQAITVDSQRLDPVRWAQRPWRERFLDRLAFALMRLALFLTGQRY